MSLPTLAYKIQGGNSSQVCGGPNRITVYSSGNLTILPVPVIQKTNLPGNWSYVSCLFDNVTGTRTLPYKMVLENNTAATCISQCQKFGYPAAGVECELPRQLLRLKDLIHVVDGDECYCGDFSDIAASGPTVQPDSDCDMPCAGNSSNLCGAGARLAYYSYNSTTPLYSFSYPAGGMAGSYQFLIGGVVVPLMTIHGVNGKVSFVEKFGTG